MRNTGSTTPCTGIAYVKITPCTNLWILVQCQEELYSHPRVNLSLLYVVLIYLNLKDKFKKI